MNKMSDIYYRDELVIPLLAKVRKAKLNCLKSDLPIKEKINNFIIEFTKILESEFVIDDQKYALLYVPVNEGEADYYINPLPVGTTNLFSHIISEEMIQLSDYLNSVLISKNKESETRKGCTYIIRRKNKEMGDVE